MAKMQLPDAVVDSIKAAEVWGEEVKRIVGLIDSATNGAYAALKEAYGRHDLQSQRAANDQIIRIAELRSRVLTTFHPPPENGIANEGGGGHE